MIPDRARLLPVGAKVRFAGERRRYTVRAANERFAICTKPFAAVHGALYTIIDFDQKIRGRENLIFCLGFITDEQCQEALERLSAGETEISHRHYVALDIEDVSG